MKNFLYDTLLDAENICNLKRETKLLMQGVKQQKKLVVYGVRNCGKTSLVKNVIVPHFQKMHKTSFVLFCDLMDVKSLDDVQNRIKHSFEKSFANSFPAQQFLKAAKDFLWQHKPQIEFDPATGQPTISLGEVRATRVPSLVDLFETITNKIAKKIPTLIVLDEFQDIAFVPQAQGLFRQVVQELKDVPVIFLGSKKHILSDLFAKPRAPLAQVGEDVAFMPIAYEEYHAYMQERFESQKIDLDFACSKFLQDLLHRVPEPINIVCAHIFENLSNTSITPSMISVALDQVVEKRSSRYQEYLSHFSEKEEHVLAALAKEGVVLQPSGKEFLHCVDITARTASQSVKKFLNKSIVEKTPQGYR